MSTIINGTSSAITFPDSSVQNTSAIVSGSIPTSIMPVGSVIQTVGGGDTTTYTNNSTTPVTTSSMSITLTNSASKVAVFFWTWAEGTIGSSVPGVDVYLYRGGSALANRTRILCSTSSGQPSSISGGLPMMYLDTPATTSPNYQIALSKTSGAGSSTATQYWAYWVIQEIKV